MTLEATGRLEKQADITGEVYNLRYIAEDGKEHRTELVLSGDARAKAFRDAMSGMAQSLSKSVGKNFESTTNNMQTKLNEMDMGVLRYGDDMYLSAISDRTIDESRFVLPAEPTDLSSIGAMMSQGGSRGDKGAEGDQGQKSDEEASDNPLGKVLGKLFGK